VNSKLKIYRIKSLYDNKKNLQNIPSHSKEIRLIFDAGIDYKKVEIMDNYYDIPYTDEVETQDGWKFAKDIKVGDHLLQTEDTFDIVEKIEVVGDIYRLYV